MNDCCTGLLFIGDPHVASRPPGFRKDDYPQAILQKLQWSLDYARENRLRPVLLGDLFDFPRDNANWLIVRLLQMFDPATLAISGNHDCKENTLAENDTLSVLVAAGALRLLTQDNPWVGVINNRPVIIGGTCWGDFLPKSFPPPHSSFILHPSSLVFWATHHDLRFPGYEESARLDCREIPGIDVVINGHIHRDLGRVQSGKTLWINPGNIARIARSDASRDHVPSVLRIDITDSGIANPTRIPIPCQPFEDVFHGDVQPADAATTNESIFIRELALLESVRTASGAGLRQFLDANVQRFDPKVAAEIHKLAEEVLTHAD
ncbi:MAG: metallophosphoesterase [Phycisphaerales bacterium]|nr:metallophosphoesterase [Phycisphaerales bacterium]